MRIAETIDAFYGDAGAKDGVSRSYKQAVEDLDAETIKALDGPYRTTVLEPISRFCSYFPDVNECMSRPSPHLHLPGIWAIDCPYLSETPSSPFMSRPRSFVHKLTTTTPK